MVKGIEEAKKNESGLFVIRNIQTGKYFVKIERTTLVRGETKYKIVDWSNNPVAMSGKAAVGAAKRLTTPTKGTEINPGVVYPTVTEKDIEIVPLTLS